MAAAAPAPKAPTKAGTDKADTKPVAKVTKKAVPTKTDATPAKEAPAKEAVPAKAETKPVEAKAETVNEEAAPKAPAKKAAPAKKEVAPKKAAKKSDADDLKKIEGIGPKIADTLNGAGVTTFAKLAGMDRDAIKVILDTVSTLKSKEPKTWPQQAQLAADGKWDELKVLQDELMGGI
ncbi:MAG: helix-hairpin-helix domain-containing protein [Cocleimonas sp.]